jgi:hypothetical protein
MSKQRTKTTTKKKPAGPNNKSSLINNKCKVWRIFHFQQRYELPDDMRACRQSGLQYTKRFVGVAGGDEAVGYQSQFGMLQNGDGLESCTLEGIYGRLVTMAAQHSRAKRGYLLDADDKPLSYVQIGKLLNINARTMSKYMRLFESVKLIEKVEMPEFDMRLNEPPPRKNSDLRTTPEKSGKNRAPLKKRQNGKREKEKVNKQRATHGLTAVEGEENNNGNSANHQANAQERAGPQGKAEGEPPSTPSTAPPLPSGPHVSDDLGDSKVIRFTDPQTSLEPNTGRQRRPSGTSAVDYDKYDEQIGTKVYVALGFTLDVQSGNARREICSFASKWHQARVALARLPPPVLDELARRVIAEARKIGRRRGNRNKAAVWCTVVDKLVTARLREAM